MTPTEKIDAALDSVLAEFSTFRLKNEPPQTADRMRKAMRKIMSDSYIAGSNAAHDAMKGK